MSRGKEPVLAGEGRVGEMYNLSPEEFFMYLIIALIFIIPISVRIYRRLGLSRLKARLKEKDIV